MPELPEVETVVRSLRNGGAFGLPVIGRTVASAQVLWDRSIQSPDAHTFCQLIPDHTVLAVERRGKFIIMRMGPADLLVHLRMSGDLRVETLRDENSQPRQLLPHDRVVIDFQDETRLVFNNPRKFGRMWLVPDAAEVTGHLGPEPLSDEMTGARLFDMLQQHKRMLKPLLMDQTFLAGMGNIYTDEALYLAGLHPRRQSASLTRDEADHLMEAIRQVLQDGIRANGASIDWVYRGGGFQNQFRVYQRTGEACMRCGHTIERTVVGQRGTHFCPLCQPLEGGQDA
ncbi:MAG: bifunctional DNA-formamidopyrimidine glycosylase/DNA-(apurinic or apyrimidinic site) lyase [Anaerolineae bacterium]|nr:bifunctional DNA-formamidopyrimidine glycosylase/DNA-(apurinic or apyrimidinic site) lyase [Anaerolineae bacterium]